MLKMISAALIAASVLAAPAVAATSGESTQAPVTKMTPKATNAARHGVQNANGKLSKRHIAHVRHYKHHKKVGAIKAKSKVSFDRAANKRG
jgi:hypothetical protein